MTEKKKMGAGLVLSVITVLVTVAGLVLYMMNCKTNYFVKTTGTDNTIVACLAVAAILEIVMIIVSVKMGAKPVLDIIPVACGVLTAYALIAFVGSRIAAIGSIMTFENNAQNMADLKGAIIGMIVCAVALIFTIISSSCITHQTTDLWSVAGKNLYSYLDILTKLGKKRKYECQC